MITIFLFVGLDGSDSDLASGSGKRNSSMDDDGVMSDTWCRGILREVCCIEGVGECRWLDPEIE